MNRSIPIHPWSLLVGIAFTLVVLVAMGQSSQFSLGQPVRVEYGPHPRDMVQIKQGTPYSVPPGRLFVLTGLGCNLALSSSGVQHVDFRVNGQSEIWTAIEGNTTNSGIGFANSVATVPSGFTALPGSTVEVVLSGSSSAARAWGYLAPL